MDPVHLSALALTCKLSGLVARAQHSGAPETVFSLEEPLLLMVQVEFVGSGAIALMPLKPCIQVDFYARGFGQGKEIELGHLVEETTTKQFIYQPTLTLVGGLRTTEVLPEKAYTLSALIRVGACGYPSLVIGLIEGLIIQTYE